MFSPPFAPGEAVGCGLRRDDEWLDITFLLQAAEGPMTNLLHQQLYGDSSCGVLEALGSLRPQR